MGLICLYNLDSWQARQKQKETERGPPKFSVQATAEEGDTAEADVSTGNVPMGAPESLLHDDVSAMSLLVNVHRYSAHFSRNVRNSPEMMRRHPPLFPPMSP